MDWSMLLTRIRVCRNLMGIEIWPETWREKFLDDEAKMAFVTDPDGYEVEILERQ